MVAVFAVRERFTLELLDSVWGWLGVLTSLVLASCKAMLGGVAGARGTAQCFERQGIREYQVMAEKGFW